MSVSKSSTVLPVADQSARELLETCLVAARDPQGEGARVFTELYPEAVSRAAEISDQRRARGMGRALEGKPISIKDLFDIRGSVTRAGSFVLKDASPAAADAITVGRLCEAGAVIVGKTNMTEFAYSGVGLNPHFGTPLNPHNRRAQCIPGGSSSGAAVSVSDGMAWAGLGTDTGGSVRIPAALCGLVGWKPTASRISLKGVLPLSPTLDSVGPIASNVASCALLDSVLSGEEMPPGRTGLSGVRLVMPSGLLTADVDASVAQAISRALSALSRAGAEIVDMPLPEIDGIPAIGATPVIVAAEAYRWHRDFLTASGSEYDPRVRSRLERGGEYTAWEYLDALKCRASSIAAASAALQGFDGWISPTVPVVAPPVSSCDLDEEFFRLNKLLLRNPSIVNFLDGCAITLPCHRPGEAPVGLMFAGMARTDHRILRIALQIERILHTGD
jgi:aspartyl-tRNA(Asn)/glutamyl-tRNA(Gln) amidotransferase subunit A